MPIQIQMPMMSPLECAWLVGYAKQPNSLMQCDWPSGCALPMGILLWSH